MEDKQGAMEAGVMGTAPALNLRPPVPSLLSPRLTWMVDLPDKGVNTRLSG